MTCCGRGSVATCLTSEQIDRDLLELLREDAVVYRGMSPLECERLRAFLIVRGVSAGRADELLALALEDLETGQNAFAIAAAARVVAAASHTPDEAAHLLMRAISRLRLIDEHVSFDTYPARLGEGATAMEEAVAALGALGVVARGSLEDLKRIGGPFSEPVTAILDASLAKVRSTSSEPVRPCCGSAARQATADLAPMAPSLAGVTDVEVENQAGERMTLGQLFAGRAGVVAFFYTRCMSPEKCSLTVSKLGRVSAILRREGKLEQAIVVGVSYDPDFDSPDRLRRYGEDRGLVFSPQCQLLRTTGPFDAVREGLGLGVGFGEATVNRHRIEMALVNPAGEIVTTWLRRVWDETEVARSLAGLAVSKSELARS